MKRIFILVGFCLSTTVSADTVVYGRLHISINKVSHSDVIIQSHKSRIGLKGINALDNGLKATHQIEFDYDFTKEEKALLVRHSWIGIRGGFGEFRVGRQTTPYSALDNPVNYLQRNGLAFHADSQSSGTLSYLNKVGSYGFATSFIASSSDDNGTANLLINYKTYPLYAGLAYQKTPSGAGEDGIKLALAHRNKNYAVGLVAEKAPVSGDKINTLTGKYITGNFWFSGQYSKNNTAKHEQKNIEIGYKLGKKTKAYYEWEDIKGVKSNHIGLAHDF